jgi:hypothetical protein
VTTLSGIRTELAVAIRRVNAAYLAIPERHRPPAAPWPALEAEVNAACASGDRDRALAAIAAWRDHHVSRFTNALLNAPLDYEKARAKERQREHGATAPGRSANTSDEFSVSVGVREATTEAGRKFGVSRDSVEGAA